MLLNLKENKEPVNEIAIAGGLVTGGGFTSANYKDFFGLSEAEGDPADATTTADEMERAAAAAENRPLGHDALAANAQVGHQPWAALPSLAQD